MTEKRFQDIGGYITDTDSYCCTKVYEKTSDIIDLLNELYEENQQLRLELDTHKHPLWSTREAERKVNELTNLLSNEIKKNAILLEEINSLRIENMRLKKVKEYD